MKFVLCFYINRLYIAVIADDGDFAFEKDFLIPETYSTLLQNISNSLQKTGLVHKISTISVSISGYQDQKTQQIYCPSIPVIHAQRLKADLQASLNKSVNIISHGHAIASAAAKNSLNKPAQVVFGLFLDDEVCGGLVIDKMALTGANGLAGNWGHISLPWPVDFELEDRECSCGRSGCLCLFVNTHALSREYQLLTETKQSAEAIFARAEQGDIVAESAVQVFEDRLARGLALVINLCDPELIVLGGRMASHARLYKTTPRKWPGYVNGGAPLSELICIANSPEETIKSCLIGSGYLNF